MNTRLYKITKRYKTMNKNRKIVENILKEQTRRKVIYVK